ncbi:aspartyl protease family protein [Autumnicola edwardsiae]|uniref:Aspartyl protease family protein n=1 Tax=Autumnicola edwardsiae TaxID=3075594 RepID=A0ABU3CZN3_9FLAO|nr:aspartyl protease family protein [Zunongwangia sp. F297]MDT0651839.1 aspartyl protease family protein [Zunongwangia sp. F297]
MTKKLILAIITITIVSILSVNAQNDNLKDWVEGGKVENKSYYTEIPFQYIDGYIFIEITQNEKKYNFLFDTGAEATIIDKSIINEFSFKRLSQVTVGGPIIDTEDLQKLVISKINIAEITYNNIGAVSTNLAFSKTKFCDKLHGIIGSNLIKKSKWQLDYDNEIIKISNDLKSFNIGTPKFVLNTKLPARGFGTETIDITINKTTLPFNIDTGNGRRKFVANPKYFKKVIRKSDADEYGFPKSDKDF